MAQVTIRNLDGRVVHRLKMKAELQGKSLEEILREIVTSASRLTPKEKLATVDRIRAMSPRQTTDSTELIREVRDSH